MPINFCEAKGPESEAEIDLNCAVTVIVNGRGRMTLMSDTRQPQDLKPQLRQQELDLIRLNRSLELANLELERAQRQQREFLANTAHELRTPLNAILSFLRLVLDDLCDSPEEARQFLQNAYDSAHSLLVVINERLDSAKIEAGKMDLQLTEVNVAAIFTQVENVARRQADQHKVRLTFRPPRMRVLVRADPVKLSQVLLNLVAHAIQSTAKGEVRVQARSWRDKGHVQFQVRGIKKSLPGERQGHLSGAANRENGGSSLGLAVCRTMVECMGGQIWLSSQGRDASIFFTLPLVTPQPLYWRRTTDRERGLEI
jgi:signal transduction histidine kinase